MAFSRGDWAAQKAEIALALGGGACGGGYGEGAIILCAAISAMAAEAWPEKGNDRKRFVEGLIRFSKLSSPPETISVPLLTQHLKIKNCITEAEALEKSLLNFPYGQILTGAEVDQPEKTILKLCSTLKLTEVRRHSYANLIYKLIRSPYSHQYYPDENASPFPMTMDKSAGVSYVNRLNPARPNAWHRYLICFHLDWLADLTVNMGKSLDAVAATLPLETPTRWWLDG